MGRQGRHRHPGGSRGPAFRHNWTPAFAGVTTDWQSLPAFAGVTTDWQSLPAFTGVTSRSYGSTTTNCCERLSLNPSGRVTVTTMV